MTINQMTVHLPPQAAKHLVPPPAGRDVVGQLMEHPAGISIHPPPCGGGTGLFAYYYIVFRFQSTHPVQSGTLGSISQTAGNFNPRGPEQISPKAQVFISPHAALMD